MVCRWLLGSKFDPRKPTRPGGCPRVVTALSEPAGQRAQKQRRAVFGEPDGPPASTPTSVVLQNPLLVLAAFPTLLMICIYCIYLFGHVRTGNGSLACTLGTPPHNTRVPTGHQGTRTRTASMRQWRPQTSCAKLPKSIPMSTVIYSDLSTVLCTVYHKIKIRPTRETYVQSYSSQYL